MHIPENFISNFDLKSSLEQLQQNDSPEGKHRFFQQLKQANLLVPYRGKPQNLALIINPEKEAFLPAFTCVEEFDESRFPDCGLIVLHLPALRHVVLDQPKQVVGIALNPFGKAVLLRQKELEMIDSATEGMTLRRTEHAQPPEITALHNCPVGLPTALNTFFRGRPEVYRAWILAARQPEEKAPHKLILIDFDGDNKLLFPQVARIIRPFLCPGESFELMKADFKFIQLAQNAAKPFYVR